MTLPAVDTWNVRGQKGPLYKVGPTCSHPSCDRWADHAHHIVRRSQLGGDYPWVVISGTLYPNLTGLCVQHHDEVTGRVGGHKAAIRLIDETGDGGLFYWSAVEQKPNGEIVYLPFAPLDPQPPSPESLAQRVSPTAAVSENCPYCGQVKRRRRSDTRGAGGERRRRKSWTIKVPVDDEDGATVLQTLVEEIAGLLDIEADAGGRYYVVVPALVFALQHKQEFAQNIRGVG